jgi:hypothetical protein
MNRTDTYRHDQPEILEHLHPYHACDVRRDWSFHAFVDFHTHENWQAPWFEPKRQKSAERMKVFSGQILLTIQIVISNQ